MTSADGTVNEGTETFTILSGTTTIGSAVTVDVGNGAASTSYVLPAAASAGTYIIQAVYHGTANFLGSTDTSHSLTIGQATTSTAAASTSATFSTADQTVPLTATVASAAGTVNEGTETFTILNGTTVIGSAVTVNVRNGTASTATSCPPELRRARTSSRPSTTARPTSMGSTDTSHSLTISRRPRRRPPRSTSTMFSTGSQAVPLSATVTSAAGTVDAGTETFTILSGTTAVGSAVTVNVSAGTASAGYVLPAGTPPGTYIIQAVYNGTTDFAGSTDTSHSLTVSVPATVDKLVIHTQPSSIATAGQAFSPSIRCLSGRLERQPRDER